MRDAAKVNTPITEKSKMAVIVLGMHRSGTSAVTRGLEVLGVQLGDNLHPSGEDNPKGFWEDKDCLQLNERILSYLGSAYDRLGLVEWDIEHDDPQLAEYAVEAEELVRAKLHVSQYWGFKDPRTARLLPFWMGVLDRVGCDVGFVIAIRNPLSVMRSLQKRNGFEPEKSFYLWLEHVVPAVARTKGKKRVVVDYDALLDAPEVQLRRIARDLRLPEPDAAELAVYERDFLEGGLRHTAYSSKDLEQDPAVPPQVRTAYDTLLRVSSDELRLDDLEVEQVFSQLLRELASLLPALNLITRQESRLWEQGAALHSGNETLHHTQLTLSDTQMALRRSEEAANVDRQRLSDVTEAVLRNARTIESLQGLFTEYAERTAESIRVLATSTAEFAQQIESSNRVVQAGEHRIESLTQTIHALAMQVDELRRTRSWRWVSHLRSASHYARRVYWAIRRRIVRLIRALWRGVPLSRRWKEALKAYVFTRFAAVLQSTTAWQQWNEFRHGIVTPLPTEVIRYPQRLPTFDAKLPDYMPLTTASPLRKKEARLICFYLPQFHPIPENDEWWGRGFTEWTNVRPAQPQFVGHYQPHVPGELGYYSLLDPAVQRRQIELAKLYGVEGFCFYFYWFAGKRLLETPIERYLNDPTLDLPFCLCWANENWSRRWDGLDSEILIAQQHSPEDDLAFIAHVSRYMRDPRYIRVGGRPLLLVYRPGLLPQPKKTVDLWRDWCRENGYGEIYLAYTQSFESVDPREYGFDAAIEFPPNNTAPPPAGDQVTPLRPDFGSAVYDWRALVLRSREYATPPYTLFRGVCPAWDNTARKKNRGAVLLHSSPRGYEEWLGNAVEDTVARFPQPDERLVFINAWNEWAEGAHLEPDAKYGYAYLDATRKALENNRKGESIGNVVVVTHDAYPHGAQYLALNIVKELAEGFHLDVEVVCLGGGPLKSEFTKYARFHDLEGKDSQGDEARLLVAALVARGHQWAIVNTSVSGLFLELLKSHGVSCVSLVHELGGILDRYGLANHAAAIAAHADKVVFPAEVVKESFSAVAPLREGTAVIRPQGLYKRNRFRRGLSQARKELRKQLKLPRKAAIVLGVGYADHRKGVDLFLDAGLEVLASVRHAYMVWVGHWDKEMEEHVLQKLEKVGRGARSHFVFPGRQDDTDLFYAGADAYALTSREDPFPSVALEAMEVAVPVVCFGGTGGIPELVEQAGAGLVVPAFDVGAYADALRRLLTDRTFHDSMGANGQSLVDRQFSFRHYLFDVLAMLRFPIRKVSVVVPNYNYAHYLRDRIKTIVDQSYPIYELILLDDCSSDGSVELLSQIAAELRLDCHIECASLNSGSVFAQWAKGLRYARGDFVWIAEADDLSTPDFLMEVMRGFDYPGVVMSYCESYQIDSVGNRLGDNYLEYVADVDENRWLSRYVAEGTAEIVEALSIKNTIPNVSAVVFHRGTMLQALEAVGTLTTDFRVAGDWRLYIEVLQHGRIAFTPRTANLHRRHQRSVTHASLNLSQFLEIVRMQKLVAGRYALPPEKMQAARAYAEKLYRHFDLAATGAPAIDDIVHSVVETQA